MVTLDDRDDMMAWLDQQQQPMLDLLEQIVNIDSNSYDLEGVDAVGDAIKAHLEARGIETEIIPRPNAGFCLVAKVGAGEEADNAKPVLLCAPSGTNGERCAAPACLTCGNHESSPDSLAFQEGHAA